jgi:hypothetical protein
MRIPTHNSTKPDPGPIQYTLTNSLHMHQRSKTNSAMNPPQHIVEPHAPVQILNHGTNKASDTLHHSGSHHYNSTITPCSGTLTTQTLFSTMAKAPMHGIRARTALKKKNNTAADDLQKQVALEKKMREDKKKKRAEEKKAD